MSKIGQLRILVSEGLYYLTEHANNEAIADGFNVFDVENGILTGKIRRAWSREGKYEVIGSALNKRNIGIVCKITETGKVCIITVYEYKLKR